MVNHQLLLTVRREGVQPEHSSRPHNGAAPQGPSGVCGDKFRIQLISEGRGPMCLPHQARNRVESIHKMKGIKKRGYHVCSDPPVMTLPRLASFHIPISERGRWFADKIPSVTVALFFSRHEYLPKAVTPPS